MPPLPEPFTTEAILEQMDRYEHAYPLKPDHPPLLCQPTNEERSATLVLVHVPGRPHRMFQWHRHNVIFHDTDVPAHRHLWYVVADVATSIVQEVPNSSILSLCRKCTTSSCRLILILSAPSKKLNRVTLTLRSR